jgi:D-beta-D-heptose 7-phosphate kinase/D-beta-D-heptose 1-phosphate adenosyltransferase
MDTRSLEEIIARFPDTTVLVLGDLMVDSFLRGSVRAISDEAPVPVLEYRSALLRPGGAANVMANIRALGGGVIAAGAVGDDPEGRELAGALGAQGVDTTGIQICRSRPTTVKTRIISDRYQQHLLHMVREDPGDLPPAGTRTLVDFVKARAQDADAVVISDYDKGVVTAPLLQELIPYLRGREKPIVVDARVEHFLEYQDVTLVKVTNHVAGQVAGITQVNDTSLRNIGQWMLTQLGSENVLITRGKEGMSLFERNGKVCHIPSVAREVRELTGVADTVTAVIALSLAVDRTRVRESAVLANTTAGVVVGKLGSATVTPDELRQHLGEIRGRQLLYEIPR